MAEGGRIVYYLDVDDSQFTTGLNKASGEAKKAGKAIGDSFGQRQQASFLAMGAAVTGLGAILAKVLKDSVVASNKTENAFAGLASATRAYGQDSQKTRQAAIDLSKDGLISVTTAAQGLESLFIGGLGIDQAVKVMEAYKDQAAFGKNATLSMDEAVGNLAQSFVTENSAIGNASGQAENYTNIIEIGARALGKSVSSLSERERAQAKFIGTMRIATVVEGNAAKLADTFSGKQARLQTAFFLLQSQIGDTVKLGLGPFIDRITDYITKNPRFITSMVLAVSAAISFSAAILGIAAAIKVATVIMGGPFSILLALVSVLLGKVVFDAINKVQDSMKDMVGSFEDGAGNIANQAKEELSGQAAKAARDLAESLEEIDRQIVKSKETFTEQLAEMVRASNEKVDSLQSDLEEENRDFAKSAAEKKKIFDRETLDEQKGLEKRLANVQKSFDKEVAAAVKSQEKRTEEFNKALEKEKEAYNNASDGRLAVLETQYKEELAKGQNADKSRLIQLSNQINKERLNTKSAIEERIRALKEGYDRDTEEFRATNQEKLAELNATIEEEKTTAAESQARKKEEYDADVLAAQEAHDKKVAATQTELDAELALQNKHKDLILSVRDFQYRDEFQKLVSNHDAELIEYDRQKEKLIKKAKEITASIDTELENTGKDVNRDKLSESGNTIGTEIGTAIVESIKSSIANTINRKNFAEGLGALGDVLKVLFVGKPKKGQSLKDAVMEAIVGLETGGPARKGQPYIVGEKRPELFVPDSNGTIVPNLSSLERNGGQTVNNYYTTVNPNFDGIVARSRSEWRDIVKDGLEAVNEELRSRGIPQIGGGMLGGISG